MTISAALRSQLSKRAHLRCEYCLLHEDHSIKRHEPDHTIPKKHGGELTPLFNPRKHQWADHFSVEMGEILPKSRIGRVTIIVLQLNRPGRIVVRAKLTQTGHYP